MYQSPMSHPCVNEFDCDSQPREQAVSDPLLLNKHYHCLLYYGTQIPNPAVTSIAGPTHVVLQDYHPLVQNCLFGDYFPQARRFLYWNPCKIWVGEGADPSVHKLPSCDYSLNWHTKTLNLEVATARNYVIEKALSLLAHRDVEGLFVDDLDILSLNEDSKSLALELLIELNQKAKKNICFFFNRGFFAWSKIKNIEAVLLEGLYGHFPIFATDSERQWLRQSVIAHLRLIKTLHPALPIFALRYPDQPITKNVHVEGTASEATIQLSKELQALISNEFTTTKNIDQWPWRYL